MNPLGLTFLVGNLVVAPLIIMLDRSTRGVCLAIATGWILLSPRAGINLPGIPAFTKDFSVSYGVLIGLLLFRGDLIRRFRPRPIDLFCLLCMIGPFISSLANGLGVWDACSELYGRIIVWGTPYLVGRVLVKDLDDVRDCALAILLAALIIVPLCLVEIRLSPQLHRWVYGTHAAPFHMAKRLGGYRPTLMFRHGIEVGTWLATGGIIGIWFSMTGTRRHLFGVSLKSQTAVLLVVNLISRSLGSIALLTGSCFVAVVTRTTRTRLALLALAIATPTYLALRITNVWSPVVVIELVDQFIDSERAESFSARVFQEEELGNKARRKIFFGWGGHNRFRVFDDAGEQTTAVDPLWLITFGKYGLFGIVGLYGMLCLPAILVTLRTPARYLLHPKMAGVVALMLAMAIATGDSLQNAFFSPLMMVAAGVLSTTAVSLRSWLPRSAAPRFRQDATTAPHPGRTPVQSGQIPQQEE